MRRLELQAIYVMWLRQMKRFVRSKSRVVGAILQPLFFLAILGSGLRGANIAGMTGDYMAFIAPGIVAMSILFSSMYTGISVLWDKQFGFLQEVLVAPISRFSIILGRTLGGGTTALIQGFIILVIAIGLGVRPASIPGLILTIIFMVVISFTAVGFGLAIASKMENFQGFQVIMNIIILPLFFLSTALFPIATNENIPGILVNLSFANPLFYLVDGLRGSLTGMNYAIHPLIDLGIAAIICLAMIGIGSYLFSKSEV